MKTKQEKEQEIKESEKHAKQLLADGFENLEKLTDEHIANYCDCEPSIVQLIRFDFTYQRRKQK